MGNEINYLKANKCVPLGITKKKNGIFGSGCSCHFDR